jgi:hypothetical protein
VLVGTDVGALQAAVAEAERFPRDHRTHERAGTPRFFLAVDHYRIARNVGDPARRREHEQRARQALRQTVERSGAPFEVGAAETLLERLGGRGDSALALTRPGRSRIPSNRAHAAQQMGVSAFWAFTPDRCSDLLGVPSCMTRSDVSRALVIDST